MKIAFVLTLLFAASLVSAEPNTSKKLIEFGWDEPNTNFMRTHIAELEQTPFDGTVFMILATEPNGKKESFLDNCWGTRKFTESEFAPAAEDLKQTPFKKFTENFLRFDVTPGSVDWFDDFSAVTNNARLAAKIAKNGHARGILFDTEQYGSPLWNYSKQRDAKTKSYEEYSHQAEQRGRELMDAFQSGYGDNITIFMTFGQSLVYTECNHDSAKLPKITYGLLTPFLNGMTAAAHPGTKIIDGFEMSYAYKQQTEFTAAQKLVHDQTAQWVSDPQKYKQVVELGFGLWLDEDWRKYGWSTSDFTKNYFTPATFQQSLHLALTTTDRYVWIYTEKPQWWSPHGPQLLPQPYVDAVRSAQH